MIEPALEKCSIIYGPDVANHKSISKNFLESEGAIQIQNEEELYKNICYLFMHKEERKQLAASSSKQHQQSKQQQQEAASSSKQQAAAASSSM